MASLKNYYHISIVFVCIVSLSSCHIHHNRDHSEIVDTSQKKSYQHLRINSVKVKQKLYSNGDFDQQHNDQRFVNDTDSSDMPVFFYYLSEGYADLAQQEDYEHHFIEQSVFEDKSARSKIGMQVVPHQVEERKVPEWSIKELKSARKKLMMLLTPSYVQQYPYLLAQSQVMYDCWLEEQEENINKHDINICRNAFYIAYNQIILKVGSSNRRKYVNYENISPQVEVQLDTSCDCLPTTTAKLKTVLSEPFILYFELDSAELTDQSIETIKRIEKAVIEYSPREIIVQGHTDRSGKQSYNTQLSGKRVQSVIAGLLIAGLDKEKVKSGHYGEEKPRIMTPDGEVKAANRRVEIRFEG